MTLAAVVLAAGAGSRWSGPAHKLLTPFRGKPLVRWAIESAIAADLDETIVVMGAVDLSDVVPDDVTVVLNHAWASGQAVSARTATAVAQRAGHDAIVVGLGDMPDVPPSAWRAVAEADGPLVTATFDGVRRPPVKIGSDLWPLLPPEGDAVGRHLMRLRPGLVQEVACEGRPIDLDTLEDAARWS
jgi:CTP:molybdopterin cytidylyltransferase MocA